MSGPAVVTSLRNNTGHAAVPWTLKDVKTRLVPDERKEIQDAIVSLCDESACNVVFTTGGTGFSPRDVTPEATRAVSTKLALALSNAAAIHTSKYESLSVTSRGIAAVRNKTLILNLPESWCCASIY